MADQSGNEVVIKVHMHCRGCVDKVSACLRGFDGVEQIVVDRENHKVITRGANLDPLMILEMVRKKHYGSAELISPKITGTEKPEPPEPPPVEPKEAPIKIVVLEVPMHCPTCAVDIRRKLFEIEEVLTVEPNMEERTVIVKGAVDSLTLVEHIRRKLGKHAEIVSETLVVPEKKKKKKKKKKKVKEEEQETEDMVVFHYPCGSGFDHDFCPCEAFDDESVHSCLIM